MLAKTRTNRDGSPVHRKDAERETGAPPALAGAPRVAALLWLVAVVGVYLAVREFGLALVH
jgi:hypothetical protein